MSGDSSSRSIGDGVIRRNLNPFTAGVDGLSDSAFPSTPTCKTRMSIQLDHWSLD